jgi:TetR/AcrR family transcriptional regulator
LKQALDASVQAIRSVEKQMSLFDPDSAVSRLNRLGELRQPDVELVSVLSLAQQIVERDYADPKAQIGKVVAMMLQFAEKNPGMTRVMVGDALVFEHERLQTRMNQFFDKMESTLKQSLRDHAQASGSATPSVDAQVQASVLTAFVVGRLQRFARSGFRRMPTEQLELSLARLI